MDKVTPYLKAYAALVGSIATALLGVYTTDTKLGQALTVISIIATVFATWRVPNLDPKAEHQDESVQPPNSRSELGAVSVLYGIGVGLLVLGVILVLVDLLTIGVGYFIPGLILAVIGAVLMVLDRRR